VHSFREKAVIAGLREVVDELAGSDPFELSDAALAVELLAMRSEIDRLEALFAQRAALAHRRGVGALDGAHSTASWLRSQAGMREWDAKAAIEAGAVCELLPETGAAWRAGEISSGAARTIFGARVDGHDDELRGSESALLDLARRGDLKSLRLAARHFRNLARAGGSEPSENDGLHLSQTYDGVTAISGELTDLAAETVVTAIHAYTDPPTAEDTRTLAQRTAAALVQICKVALQHSPEAGRESARITAVVDWKTVTESQLGRSDGDFTGAIHPADVQRLLCDSTVSRVVMGPDSLPLDVGRSRRTIPPAIRRAVIARDGGCRFPNCNRPPGWCQIHHVVHWLEGGLTAVCNLVPFCDHHHHVVHQRGWRVTFDGSTLRVFRPDGAEVLDHARTQAPSRVLELV
jgi:Domain of unknown function (DUF222)